jgi:hypothetical protein
MKNIMGGMIAAALLVSSPLAVGHPTGHESRTVQQCERLPTPERQACIRCVTRPVKHHFHPDYPAGKRCRPDNGRP